MKLGQTRVNGVVCAALFEDAGARIIAGHTALDVILDPSLVSRASVPAAGVEPVIPLMPIIPIHPPEVWGCGCTYETSATFRDAEHGTREGMYAHVYREARPEVFFKGTARHCVGTGDAIGIRPDSRFTAPEPELALVLGPGHGIFGFTLANDVSAWDIERENALYLTQSKVYDRCCALGPGRRHGGPAHERRIEDHIERGVSPNDAGSGVFKESRADHAIDASLSEFHFSI